MRTVLFAVLCLAACNKPHPETTLSSSSSSDDGPAVHVLGAPLHVYASWEASCTNWSAVFDNMLSKNGNYGEGEQESCKEKPFELTIECSATCSHHGPPTSRGAFTVIVVPEELGPLTVTATSKRTDNGQAHRVTLPPVVIVMPERLELRCALSADSSSTTPCGPEGVPAANPMLQLWIHVNGKTESSELLLVNGKPLPKPDESWLSLVDLYPAAAVGKGIQPGTYPVTLSLGTMTSTWQVVAR